MATRNTQHAVRSSRSQHWVWPVLFVIALLALSAGGFMISNSGLLNRWIKRDATAIGGESVPLTRRQALNTAGVAPEDGRQGPSVGDTATAVVAVVNDRVITQADVDLAIAVGRVFYRASQGQPPGKVDEAGVVRQLVDDALVQQAATAAGIGVTEREITGFIKQLKAGEGVEDKALAAALEAEAISMDALRAEIRRVAINNKFVQQQVAAGVPADQANTALANWLDQQRPQADIHMEQIGAAEPVASLGEPVVGALAPQFTLSDTSAMLSAGLEGHEVALSDLQGQAVLLYFWTTWCPPCRAEMPAIEATYQKYKDQGFRVLAVDAEELPASVQNFVQEFGLTFQPLLDQTGAVAKRYRVRGLPVSYFVNRQGAITAVQVGAINPQDIDRLATEAMASTEAPRQQVTASDHEDDHELSEVHWHARLRIIVNGREEQLFNLEEKKFIDIHRPNLTLGEALATHEIDYAEDCILETCQEEQRSGTLTVRINGKETTDFASHVLQDGDEIVMELR